MINGKKVNHGWGFLDEMNKLLLKSLKKGSLLISSTFEILKLY